MTPLQMLQALATLDSRTHAIHRNDAHDINLWLQLARAGAVYAFLKNGPAPVDSGDKAA